MVFRNKQSPTAMFTVGQTRYRCENWEVDTAQYRNTDELDEFLSQNPNYEAVSEGDSTAQSTVEGHALSSGGDGLEEYSVEELRRIAADELVDAPSTLARITKAETLIDKIRKARDQAIG